MTWKVLDLELPGIPKLLVKSRFDRTGYQIELTDLCRIWSESLSKDEMIQRALDEGSSIDPSEDDEQFNIFLRKIESALTCEDGTSLDVIGGFENEGTKLQLDLKAPLPHPLPSFKWTIQLQRQPEQHIEAELVTPLVLQASNLRHQISQLINELHDKDRVISKICDRLETSGNDLTTVFPGVSNIKTSRKKGQREQLAKHVKGLHDFDENGWKKQHEHASQARAVDGDVLDEVFRDLPRALTTARDVNSTRWWEALDEGSQATSKKPSSSAGGTHLQSAKVIAGNAIIAREKSMQEDEFQRQKTPPQLRRNSPARDEPLASREPVDVDMEDHEPQMASVTAVDDESTTDDEDDLDAVPRKTPNQSKPQAPSELQSATSPGLESASPRKLGTIGGRSSQTPLPCAKAATSEDKSPPPKPRSKLGAVGGKSRASVPVPSDKDDAEPTPEPLPSRTPKMGVIGGRKAKTSSSSPPPAADGQVTASPKEPSPRPSRMLEKSKTPPPRETSQERADKKRDQLKRELEEKAKAPVKKKRKF